MKGTAILHLPAPLRRDRPTAIEPPAAKTELPTWVAIVGMFATVTVIAAILISLCFLAAKLVSGHAY